MPLWDHKSVRMAITTARRAVAIVNTHSPCGSAANLYKADRCREQKQTNVIKLDLCALHSKADGGGGLLADTGEGQRSDPRPKFIF